MIRRSERKRASHRRVRSIRQPSLYSRTDEIKEKKGVGWIYPLIFCLFLAGLSYMIFFCPYFQIREVVFSETKFISNDELNGVVEDSRGVLNNNIFTFGFFSFGNRLGDVTGVESYKIIRNFPDRIYIEIVEESPSLIWETEGNRYLIDRDGYVWTGYEDKYAVLPVVTDAKNLHVEIGDRVSTNTFVEFVEAINADFENQTGAGIAKYEVLDIISDLKVTSTDGWYVYFDTTRSAVNELDSLGDVLALIKNSGSSLEYVELRINGKIFYK